HRLQAQFEQAVARWARKRAAGFRQAPGLGAQGVDVGEGFALPRPPGYCLFELCLESVEFWGNGTERLHERLRYDRDEGGWKHRYLQP
ncbi:pyridoxine 5'-phosphate oxidase C-terminal domain-containing protein, partial [Pseudomonas aeruginosa]